MIFYDFLMKDIDKYSINKPAAELGSKSPKVIMVLGDVMVVFVCACNDTFLCPPFPSQICQATSYFEKRKFN